MIIWALMGVSSWPIFTCWQRAASGLVNRVLQLRRFYNATRTH